MRLFAAELMLRINPHDPDGIDVLRGLARQPNREMAVQIAAVLQNVLGLHLGLPEGELPLSTSKEAADISRRVLAWANGADPDILRPTPGPRAGLASASRHSLPAIGSRSNFSIGPQAHGVSTSTKKPEPMDESAMLPMDESAMLPRDLLTEDVPTEQVRIPIPPPLPKPSRSTDSSAVI
jgi:hypothetical protein